MRTLYFLDYDAVTALKSSGNFISAPLVIIANGIQDLDVLLCHNAMPIFCGCPFHTCPGLNNFVLGLLVVLGAV